MSLLSERRLLTVLLLDATAMPEYVGHAGMQKYFSDPRHFLIFKAMETLWLEQGTFDLVNLVGYLLAKGELDEVGGPEYLARLMP